MRNNISTTSLSQYLTSNSARYFPFTTLLITTSDNAVFTKDEQMQNYQKHLQNSVNKCLFEIQKKFSVRTIPYHLNCVYPTMENVESCQKFMQRVGAKNVIGLGGGAALDFAKAVTRKKGSILTLVPLTLGGILASSSRHIIMLDFKEEKLTLKNNPCINERVVMDETLIAIPSWDISTERRRNIATKFDLISACIVLAIDKMIRSPKLELDLKPIISKGTPFLDAITNFSPYISIRSLPISIASILVPKFFPNANWISFVASLLPGYLTILTGNTRYDLDILSTLDWSQVTMLTTLGDELPHSEDIIEYLSFHTTDCLNSSYQIMHNVISHSLNR